MSKVSRGNQKTKNAKGAITMASAKEKAKAAASKAAKTSSKKTETPKPTAKEKAQAKSKPTGNEPLTNVKNGKIIFREGTSAGYIASLYAKHGNDQPKIVKALEAKVKAGEISCNNIQGRVHRIVYEIQKRERAGAKV